MKKWMMTLKSVILKSYANGMWIPDKEGGCDIPDYYYKGRLMTEYLIDIRHFSYNKILNDTVSENTIYQEMIKWYDSTKRRQN
jgi:hypothetical protein